MWSLGVGVAQPATSCNTFPPVPGFLLTNSSARGVDQPANVATPSKSFPPWCFAVLLAFGPPVGRLGVGQPANPVSNPPEPLPLVRGADASSRQIGGCEGIANSRQVSAYAGEPFLPKRARNLLSKERLRLTHFDKAEEGRP